VPTDSSMKRLLNSVSEAGGHGTKIEGAYLKAIVITKWRVTQKQG